jgi:putative endopeptidase
VTFTVSGTQTEIPSKAEIREKYRDHLQAMFELTGVSPNDAARAAVQVVTLETKLARSSLTLVERHDPVATYNKALIHLI